MKKILLSTAVMATMAMAGGEFSSFENSDTTLSEIEALKARIVTLENEKSKGGDADLAKKVKKLTKKIKKLDRTLKKVKAHDAYDNIKFSMDFRSTVDNINYKYNDYKYKKQDWSGTEAKNDSLFTSRVMLNMKSKPTPNLSFQGQLAAYYTWGAHLFTEDGPVKSWAGSSKSGDTIFRVRRAYFVYNNSDDFYAFSIGRRPASDGFLVNHRENNPEPASPLAHITNMEVDAAMFKLNLEEYLLSGTYVKFVYGRAHAGGMETLYDRVGYKPYAQKDGDVNENVDFFVTVASVF